MDAAPPAALARLARSYDAQVQPLRQIDAQRRRPAPAWSWTLPAGSAEACRSRDGTIFAQAYGDIVQALDARTGELLWQYTHTLEDGASPFHKRGLALHGNRLYLGIGRACRRADVATARIVWDTGVATSAAANN
jgi:alcohol dehydrogenase (cytochrome c)